LSRSARAAAAASLFLLVACRRPPPVSAGRPGVPKRIIGASGLSVFPAFSPDGKLLAYASDRTGRLEIVIRDLSTGVERALTSDGKQNFSPAFSPDGRTIAYSSKERGGLFIIPAAGGSPTPLTDFGSSPSYSPDGASIAFQSHAVTDLAATSTPALPPSTIWVAPAHGGPARDLTSEGHPAGGHGEPVFSPDGKRIYFIVTDAKLFREELWTLALDGSAARKVVAATRLYDPTISSDGRTLVLGGIVGSSPPALLRLPLRPDGTAAGAPEILTPRMSGIPRHPDISPDGRRVIFSDLATTGHIEAVRVDARGEPAGTPFVLTSGTGRDTDPVFADDGSKIAFCRDRTGHDSDIWLMNPDGSDAHAITSGPANDFLPSWYPTRQGKVLFSSDRGGRLGLHAVEVATGEVSTVVDDADDIGFPKLSPDGKELAYHAKRGGITLNVWIMNLAKRTTRQVTFDRELIGFPAYSRDGRWLSLEVTRGDDNHVAVVPSAGGTPEQLTTDHGLSWPASFSPDGTRVAFCGLRSGGWALYTVNRETKEIGRVTLDLPFNDYVRYPEWSPRGDLIVYERGETAGSLYEIEFSDAR